MHSARAVVKEEERLLTGYYGRLMVLVESVDGGGDDHWSFERSGVLIRTRRQKPFAVDSGRPPRDLAWFRPRREPTVGATAGSLPD